MPESFAPLGRPDAAVLILGTMPSVRSLQKAQYYGHPQNAFWKLLFSLWEEPFQENYGDKCHFIEKHRLLLWDVLRDCRRPGGSADAAIAQPRANDFLWLRQEYPRISAVFFNSANAARFYERLVHPDPLATLPKYTLPSSSPARAMRFEDKRRAWEPLKSAWTVAIRLK